MGAWDYGSFDNDTASDFVLSVINTKYFVKLAKIKSLSFYEFDEVRAACEVLCRFSDFSLLEQEVIDSLKEKLKSILENKEYIQSWNNPIKLHRNIRSLIKKMEKVNGY